MASHSTKMSNDSPTKKPVVIEGYHVYSNSDGQTGSTTIKHEIEDTEYDASSQSYQYPTNNTSSPEDLRELLKAMMENKGRELTVRSIIENLLERNKVSLSQNDAQALKPLHHNYKPNQASGIVLTPKEPTLGCTIQNLPNINDAIVEKSVYESTLTESEKDLICAVGSNISQIAQDQFLPKDITYYWCNFCNFKSEQKSGLLHHVMEHRFYCKYCLYQSFSRAAVINHCTVEHDNFSETAKTLKYCTYLPDIMQQNNQPIQQTEPEEDMPAKKQNYQQIHKTEQEKQDIPAKKQAKVDFDSELNMEVDEINEENTNEDASEAVETEEVTESRPTRYNTRNTVNKVTKSKQIAHMAENKGSARKTSKVVTKALSNKIKKSVSAEHNLRENKSVSNEPDLAEYCDGLPIITNVLSGQQAESAINNSDTSGITNSTISMQSTKDGDLQSTSNAHLTPASPASSVTVSSGLCWNCGYCGFVTLSQSFLKIHLNSQHQGKAHKYVAMLVSSDEELVRIKASDVTLIKNPGVSVVPFIDSLVTPVKGSTPPPLPVSTPPSLPVSTPKPAPVSAPKQAPLSAPKQAPVSTPKQAPLSAGLSKPGIIEIDNAEKEVPAKEPEPHENEKIIPVSFKCAHCNFSATLSDKVKSHLFQRHGGSVMYALDMKAVKLRQTRYIFFCFKGSCKFETKDVDDFMSHCSMCTPWLDGNDVGDIDPSLIKSLEATKSFIEKTSVGPGLANDMNPEKNAEYSCIYCIYCSNNNTRVKKHVLTNHSDKRCMMKDLQVSNSSHKMLVYFCQFCLWETRDGSDMELHLIERHDQTKDDPSLRKPQDNTAVRNAEYRCMYCNQEPSGITTMKNHVITCHKDKSCVVINILAITDNCKGEVYFCKKCLVDLIDVGELETHQCLKAGQTMEAINSPKYVSVRNTEYKCFYCNNESYYSSSMKNHVVTCHRDKTCMMIHLLAVTDNCKGELYFCKHCLLDMKDIRDLAGHQCPNNNLTKDREMLTNYVKSSENSSEKTTSSENMSSDKRVSTLLSRKSVPKSELMKCTGMPSSEKSLALSPDKCTPRAVKKRKRRLTDSSSDSKSPSDDEFDSDDDFIESEPDESTNEYTGIVSRELYDAAMSAYLDSEKGVESVPRGRPSRHAALKCRIKVKSIKAPPLYKCIHCSEIAFGTKLMHEHIKKKHDNQPLRAIDVMKQERKNANPYVCFCPVSLCTFCANVATDVVNHAKNSHGIPATFPELVRISNVFPIPQLLASQYNGRPATASTGESYECLYCSESKLYYSRKDMKKHLREQHNEDDFIFRDCIARKLRHPSRFYMCNVWECDYIAEEQRDYNLHLLGHQKATVFECSLCGWFTSVKEEVDVHSNSVHKGDKVTCLKVDLDLDPLGNAVKLVNGTKIKTEKP